MSSFFKFFRRKKKTEPQVSVPAIPLPPSVANIITNTAKDASIGIFVHINPDPDCIFSALAMSVALNELGYNGVNIFLNSEANELIEAARTITAAKNITSAREANLDLAIIMDLNTASRLGEFENCAMAAKQIVVIDHHENPVINCNAYEGSPDMCSTGEALYYVFQEMSVQISHEVAALMYVSIMADSQRLTVGVQNMQVFDIVRQLRDTGFDAQKANACLARKLSHEELRAIAKAINTAKTHGAVTVFEFDARKKDFAIDYSKIKDKSIGILSAMAGMQIMLVLTIFDSTVSGSFRSYCDKDVNVLAEKLGGGGHKKASGFVSGLPDNYIVSIAQEFFRK